MTNMEQDIPQFDITTEDLKKIERSKLEYFVEYSRGHQVFFTSPSTSISEAKQDVEHRTLIGCSNVRLMARIVREKSYDVSIRDMIDKMQEDHVKCNKPYRHEKSRLGNHHKFYKHLLNRGTIERTDRLNNINELLTYDIMIERHGCVCFISNYGSDDLNCI